MRILQSKGRSFTTLSEGEGKLSRGLEPLNEKGAAKWLEAGAKRISPIRMPAYLKDDPDLIIRQVVSILDKVVRKTTRLRDLPRQAYVDRTLLGEQLWLRISEALKEANGEALSQADLDGYKSSWSWKVHPYAKVPADPRNPLGDKNAAFIMKHEDKLRSPFDARGRWHEALWRQGSDGKADYAATADAIMSHLFGNELRIQGKKQEGSERVGKVGLAERRGATISASAPDLKLPVGPGASARLGGAKPPTIDPASLAGPHASARFRKISKSSFDQRIVDLFFHKDIAEEIHAFVQARVLGDAGPERNRIPAVRAKDLGRMLSEHFGAVPGHRDFDEATKIAIVAFYDQVKQHYRLLSKTERFRRAVEGQETVKLEALLPRDKEHLLKVLTAKDRNAEISELIRFGKLVAHACDVRPAMEAQAEFNKNFLRLATSDGQSEIKRNENFTRVWRTSVAFSLRTLDGWLKPNWEKLTDGERDITVDRHIKAIVNSDKLPRAFIAGSGIIFGSRKLEFEGVTSARRDIFAGADDADRRELAWGWLRLAAELRHRTNHFNTKQRLVSLVEGGILTTGSDQRGSFDSRKGKNVQQSALDAFAKLLKFDIDYHALLLVSDFNRLQVTRYATDEQVKDLLRRALGSVDEPVITTPKFMSVLSKAQGLYKQDTKDCPDWAKELGKLDLVALSQAPEGPNQFKIGILRHLYKTDFETWLARDANKPDVIRAAVEALAKDKERRSLDVLKGEEERVYAVAETAVDMLNFKKADGFRELAAMVMSVAFSEDNTRRTYKPKPDEQAKRSTWVDSFMRDFFVYLFDKYLRSQKLTWIFKADAQPSDAKPRAITLSELEGRTWSLSVKSWHSQLYAWLYLLPVDEVSLLRNQMRRMLILEPKGGEAKTEALRDIDRLMTLYIDVSSAGFDGSEHLRLAGQPGSGNHVMDGSWFYEDPHLFERVYSAESDTHDTSLPGTRRGLRQIARLGHASALFPIFEKHTVTTEEVQVLIETRKAKNLQDATARAKLHEDIIKRAQGIKPDLRDIAEKCGEYQKLSVDVTLHNFRAAGARLTEHARLHLLMMRVISRLADFTLIWERDKQYVLLALLYPKLLHPDETVPRVERRDSKVGFVLPAAAAATLRESYSGLNDDKRSSLVRAIALTQEDVTLGFLPLWDDEMGYRLRGYPIHLALLDAANRDVFVRFFEASRQQNEKDIEELQRLERVTGNPPERPSYKPDWKAGKRRIRNDFTHFNVINSARKQVNLTFQMNAVRSLMSYDRKLKNTVSKAIADILVDEGIDISWEMRGDRLRQPVVRPRLETNLKAVRKHRGLDDPTFVLPLVSVRYASMVKALFDFQPGGHRMEIEVGKKNKQRGPLRYPVELGNFLEGQQLKMPVDVLNCELPGIQVQK